MALRNWADAKCQGKVVVILEGGYDLEAGKACGQAVAAGLLKSPWEDFLGSSSKNESDTWRKILQEAKGLLEY